MSRWVFLSPILGLASIGFPFSIWIWIWTRPPGTFNDQGGLAIMLVYFPIALIGWLLLGPPAMLLGAVGMLAGKKPQSPFKQSGTKPMVAGVAGVLLGLLGLVLTLGTLVAA